MTPFLLLDKTWRPLSVPVCLSSPVHCPSLLLLWALYIQVTWAAPSYPNTVACETSSATFSAWVIFPHVPIAVPHTNIKTLVTLYCSYFFTCLFSLPNCQFPVLGEGKHCRGGSDSGYFQVAFKLALDPETLYSSLTLSFSPGPSPPPSRDKQRNGHMAKDKTKQPGWSTTWINICLIPFFFKKMKSWLMGLEYRVAWQEISVLPCISRETLTSISKGVAEGVRVVNTSIPEVSKEHHTTFRQIAQEELGGGDHPCLFLCLKLRQPFCGNICLWMTTP